VIVVSAALQGRVEMRNQGELVVSGAHFDDVN